MLRQILDSMTSFFPAEWVTAALTLNLISVWVVIGLFIYLGHATRKERFRLWTASWMFYSVYLAASISLVNEPGELWLVMGQRAAIGISALLMFWGSLQLTHPARNNRELLGGALLLLLWSYLAAYRIGNTKWITVPIFMLLAAANIYTGATYLNHRQRHRSARLLGSGFSFWGLHLLALPLLDWSAPVIAFAYLLSAALVLYVAFGMLIEQEQLVSEQDYQALFASASDALLLVDCADLRVLEANQAAEQISQRDAAVLTGLPLAELFPGLRDRAGSNGDAASVVAELNRAAELGWRRPDGSCALCAVRAAIVRCPRGAVLQISARDTTAQRQTDAELHLKSTALAIANTCILLSDRDGRIIWANPAFSIMTGYSLEEVCGEKAWFIKTQGLDSEIHRSLLHVLHGDRPWSGEVLNQRKDGTHYRERITITPVRDPRGVLSNFVTVKEDLDGPLATTAEPAATHF